MSGLQQTDSTPVNPWRRRWRSFFSGIGILCLVLAVMGTPAATLSWWMKDSLLTTSNVVKSFGPLVHDQRMQALIIEKASEQIWAQTQSAKIKRITTDRINKLPIPNAAKNLIRSKQNTIITELETVIDDAVTKVVQSDAFAAGWRSILQASHEDAIKTFNSDAKVGSVAAPGVGVQVGPIADAVVARLQSQGILFADLLPTKFRYTVQVLDEGQVGMLRPLARFSESFSYPLIGAVIALYALGLLLVERRWVKLAWASVAVIISMLAIVALYLTLGTGITDFATGGNFGKAASLVMQTALKPLWPLVGAVGGAAVVTAVASITINSVRRRRKRRLIASQNEPDSGPGLTP